MENEGADADVVSGIKQINVVESVSLEKENKMEGIDPGLIALLKQNGMEGKDGSFQWNNPLIWLIILGFLRGKSGLFGGDEAGGAAVGATQAKLDCLAQGQQEALAAAHNMNMTNLFHSSELAANASTQRLAAQLAECCCNLKAGQKDIVNEMLRCCCDLKAGQQGIETAICNQTNTLTCQATLNTQRIVDVVNGHANDELQQKLADCKTELAISNQTKELLKTLQETCGGGSGGGGHKRVT